MPVSVNRAPFTTSTPKIELRVPQARVLHALMPEHPEDPPSEWPTLSRAVLGVRAGYTAISGSITRALNGIRPGSSSGDAHLGLIALKLVEVEELDIDGLVETNYRITAEGIKEFKIFLANNGSALPPLRDAALCVNINRGYKNPYAPQSAQAPGKNPE